MRTTKGSARTRAKNRLFGKVKGYVGARRKLLRTAKETLVRSGVYAYAHRRLRRREFRRLWITRINAAARLNNTTYSRLVHGMRASHIALNRKMLADLAVRDPQAFAAVVALARTAQA